MKSADRKLFYSGVIVLVIIAAEMAWFLFVGPADTGSDQQAKDLFFGFSPEAWTAIFTAVLTASTVGLWLQTKRLASGAEEQSRDMKASIAATQKAADAAVAAQRPWIDFEFKVAEPLVFDADGCHACFSVKPTNIGNTPAVRVRDSVILTVFHAHDPFAEAFKRLADKKEKFGEGPADGHTIFPREKRSGLAYKITVPQSEIESGIKSGKGLVHFHGVVSVDYEFAGGAGNTTRNFIIWTRGTDEFGKWALLDPQNGTYPMEDIVITGIPARNSAT